MMYNIGVPLDDVEWYIKPSSNGTYYKQPNPTDFEIELEDLDANTYRAITTGNLISSIISINWSKCKFVFEGLTKAEAYSLLQRLSVNPIYAKIENPIWSSGFVEAQFRCSKKSIKKMKTRDRRYVVSLNLVQTNKVAGM